jgi:uroporphyrinogen-III synthase
MASGDAEKAAIGFNGLRVVAFESRMAAETAALIGRLGGIAEVTPIVREVPDEDSSAALDFAQALLAGQIDVVIFLTGVGVRELFRKIATTYSRSAIIDALARTITVARGSKSAKVMREIGLTPTAVADEPQTWREVIAALTATTTLPAKTVAVQEYGAPAAQLREELERMGARVMPVAVYRWALPEDCGPIRATLDRIAAGECDVILFTSGAQVANLMVVANQAGISEAVRRAMSRAVVCSIGPVCTATLKEHSIEVDVEPDHSRLGHLVKVAATHSGAILRRKRGTI